MSLIARTFAKAAKKAARKGDSRAARLALQRAHYYATKKPGFLGGIVKGAVGLGLQALPGAGQALVGAAGGLAGKRVSGKTRRAFQEASRAVQNMEGDYAVQAAETTTRSWGRMARLAARRPANRPAPARSRWGYSWGGYPVSPWGYARPATWWSYPYAAPSTGWGWRPSRASWQW